MTTRTAASVFVDRVSKRYGRTPALVDVSLEVEPGQSLALLGPNGAGKTTLLHILTTILRPDSGMATVAGFDVVKHPREVRRRIGMVFQESTLDDRLSVRENLEFHGLIFGVPRRQRNAAIKELLELVELDNWRDAEVRSLSGGMRRRLEIARALVHQARILFLDEPTVGLDAQSRSLIWEYLRLLRRSREITLVVTTHYIGEVENCDRVCIIDKGRVIANDAPDALRREHGQELLRVTVNSADAFRDITRSHPEAVSIAEDRLAIPFEGSEFIANFVNRYGRAIDAIEIERSSLETVFLKLTGSELRDEKASHTEQMRSIRRRGGELTR